MLSLEQKKLEHHLKKELKLEKSSIVWLHLSIKGLGLFNDLNIITNAFKNVLKSGILIIPAFTYSWSKNKKFNRTQLVEKEMGVFPNHLIKKKKFFRTNNPNFSVIIINKSKKWNNSFFKKKISPKSCFGKDSIFEVLHNISKKIPSYVVLMGGAHDDVVFRTTFLHYIEELVGVEYRYIKRFYEPKFKKKYVDQYVRYLSDKEFLKINKKKPKKKFPVTEKYKLLGKDLIKKKLIKYNKINYSYTRKVELNKFISFVRKKLAKDKNYFLK